MRERNLPDMPRFENEAEEAKWWFDHREELSLDFAAAVSNGTLGEGSVARGERKRKEAQQRESAA